MFLAVSVMFLAVSVMSLGVIGRRRGAKAKHPIKLLQKPDRHARGRLSVMLCTQGRQSVMRHARGRPSAMLYTQDTLPTLSRPNETMAMTRSISEN